MLHGLECDILDFDVLHLIFYRSAMCHY